MEQLKKTINFESQNSVFQVCIRQCDRNKRYLLGPTLETRIQRQDQHGIQEHGCGKSLQTIHACQI